LLEFKLLVQHVFNSWHLAALSANKPENYRAH